MIMLSRTRGLGFDMLPSRLRGTSCLVDYGRVLVRRGGGAAVGSGAGTQDDSRNRTPHLTTICHLPRIGVSFDHCPTQSATFLS